MNAPRDLALAGVLPRVYLRKDDPYTHRMVLFLNHAADAVDERSRYEEALLDSQIWREKRGLPFDLGYTHALEIMLPEADSFRAILWTMQPDLHSSHQSGLSPGPYRFLLFPGLISLTNWKEKHAASVKRFSVHSNLEDSEGKVLLNTFLLVLYND